MKKISRILALALGLSCIAGTATACTGEPDAGEPDTIRILAALDETKFDKDNNFQKQVEEATGIKLEFTYVSMNDYDTTVQNTVLTQKNIDLVSGGNDPTPLINQEALYPLTDLLETEMPNYNKYLTPEYKAQMVYEYEGQKDVYVIKSLREAEQGYSYMIRKDWMERANVTKIPETWDEFVDMLQKFKDTDANGDGNAENEIPLLVKPADMRATFGINSKYYWCVENGEYKAVVNHSNYKTYITEMRDLYSKGLLDKEYVTKMVDPSWQEWSSVPAAMSDNSTGATVWWAEYTTKSTEALQPGNEEYLKEGEWIGIAPIVGPNCDKGYMASQAGVLKNFMIPSYVSEDKVKTILKFIDWFCTDEGIELMNYGLEGTHYTKMEDGSKRIKDVFCTFTAARKAGLLYDPMPFMWANDSYTQMATGNSDPGEMTATGKLFYDALNANEGHYMAQAYDMATSVWQDNKTALTPMLDKFETDMITGKLSLSDYDTELQKILDAGLTECEAAQKAAYDEIVK